MLEIIILVLIDVALAIAVTAGTLGEWRKKWQRAKTIAAGTLVVAGTLQILLFSRRGLAMGILPIYNLFEVFLVLSLCAILAFLFLRIVWEIRVPAVVCAVPALIFSLLASANKTFWDSEGVLHSWLPVHVGLLILGFAALVAAGIMWILYWLQDRALRKRHVNAFCAHLPDLLTLDRVGLRLLSTSIVFFVAGTAVGVLSLCAPGENFSLFITYKIAVSIVLILGLFALYFGRKFHKISARAGTIFGLAMLAIGLILVCGVDGVRKFSQRNFAEEIDVPAEESTRKEAKFLTSPSENLPNDKNSNGEVENFASPRAENPQKTEAAQ